MAEYVRSAEKSKENVLDFKERFFQAKRTKYFSWYVVQDLVLWKSFTCTTMKASLSGDESTLWDVVWIVHILLWVSFISYFCFILTHSRKNPMANTWRKSPFSKCAKAFQTPHQKPPLAPFIAGFSFLQACFMAYNCQAGKGSLQYSRKGSLSLYWVPNGKNLG